MADELQEMKLRVDWVGVDETPLQYANRFAVQMTPTELVIIVGQATIPFFVGTPEEQRAFLQSTGKVPVRTVTRLAVTRRAVGELIRLLNDQVAKFDAQPHEGDDG